MDATKCTIKVLNRIAEKINSFEKNSSVNNLLNVVITIGRCALKENLPSSVLKTVLFTLSKFSAIDIHNLPSYNLLTKEINHFYQTESLCSNYKLMILSSFSSAVEVELTGLLKVCCQTNYASDLHLIESEMLNSCLVQACCENPIILQKSMRILKKAFILSEGNPSVAFLIFLFMKGVKEYGFDLCILEKELYHLETLLILPQQFFTESEKILFLERLIHICLEAVNMNLCTIEDLIFITAAFPLYYYQLLTLSKNMTSTAALKFLKLISKDSNGNFDSDITKCILENCLWKYIQN